MKNLRGLSITRTNADAFQGEQNIDGKDKGGAVFAQVIKNIYRYSESRRAAAVNAVQECMQDLLEKSQKLVPLDTGTLQSSGRVVAPEDGSIGGSKFTYGVVYTATVNERAKAKGTSGSVDNGDYNYAMVQHEDLEFRHSAGRQAKYLEQPFRENIDNYIERIAQAVKDAKIAEVAKHKADWASRMKAWKAAKKQARQEKKAAQKTKKKKKGGK